MNDDLFGGRTATTNAIWNKSLTMDDVVRAVKDFEANLLAVNNPRINILESRWLTKRVQYRFSRRHKKRVVKKFAKNPRNFREVPDTAVYVVPFGQICHPTVAARLRDAIKKEEEEWQKKWG